MIRPVKKLIRQILSKLVDASEIRSIVRSEVDAALVQQLRNIDYGLHLKAIMDSADFVYKNIPLHLRFTQESLRREAVRLAPEQGLFVEFGVYKGYWLNKFSEMTTRPMFGFDSFEGIPDSWTLRRKGDFAVERLPEVPNNVQLIKGWFKDTLPPFLATHPESVAFAHIDCDLYSSTKEVLDLIARRIKAGTVLVLDDFMEEPGWQNEEHKAFFEFVETYHVQFEYIGYTIGVPSSAAAVRITSIA